MRARLALAVAVAVTAAVAAGCREPVRPGREVAARPAASSGVPEVRLRVHLVGGERGVTRRYSLPVPDTVVIARELAAPHHDYPASDLMVPTGTPVFAVHHGRVSIHEGRRCGHGVSLAGDDHHRYVYCHLARVSVSHGQRVRAGDVLGLSGDTGNARGAPHLHFHVRAPDGGYRCPQPALLAWYSGRDVDPSSAGPWGVCSFPRDGVR